jgi:hypothetical protein
MKRTLEEYESSVNEDERKVLDGMVADEEFHEAVVSYVKRVRLGREIVFQTLKQAITEFDFKIRVISDSQFEIEFFGPDAPPILLVTVDAPEPK